MTAIVQATELPTPTGLTPTTPTVPVVEATPTTEPELKTGLEALTPAELAKMVSDLRKESAGHRTKLTAFEKAEADRQTAALSELEKAQQAAQTASDARAALEVKLAKRDALSALSGTVDPELAYLAIKDKIEIVDGESSNLETLVAEFIAARPAMVKANAPVVPNTKSTNPPAPVDNAPRGRPAGRL